MERIGNLHDHLTEWRIYYGDGSVRCGRTAEAWEAAPDTGVQVLVSMEPGASGWTYRADGGASVLVRDRQLWTGEDEYELAPGWGAKTGSLILDAEYWTIWKRACSD